MLCQSAVLFVAAIPRIVNDHFGLADVAQKSINIGIAGPKFDVLSPPDRDVLRGRHTENGIIDAGSGATGEAPLPCHQVSENGGRVFEVVLKNRM